MTRTLEELSSEMEKFIDLSGQAIEGGVKYLGEDKARDGVDLLFRYDFGKFCHPVNHVVPCDRGDEEIKGGTLDFMDLALGQLEYFLKKYNLTVDFKKKDEDSATIKVYDKDRSDMEDVINHLNGRRNTDMKKASFYLKCEEESLSAEESGDPNQYEESRQAWLRAN